MMAKEGNFQWFYSKQGNGQRSTVGFINQQNFLLIKEALRGGSMRYM